MKIHRVLILGVAALGGSMVYKLHSAFTDVDESGHSAYTNIAGPGSLARTVRVSSNARGGGPVEDGISIGAAPAPYSLGAKIAPLNRSSSKAVEDAQPDDSELLQAAARGDKNQVERRLSMHVKIDSRDGVRRTPLMYSSWNGYDDISNRLIAAGANPQFKDRAGNNAFDFAAGRGLVDSLHFLLQRTHTEDDQHYMEYASILQATYGNNISKLPKGSGKLASINRINPEGQTPLHIAAGNGSIEIMTALVARGAQVNIANETRQTPLHWAAWNNQAAAVDFLVAHGADVKMADLAGNTPLILAAQSGAIDAAKILLAKGADKYVSNKEGKNASIIAEDKGFTALGALLR